jgi:two-component system, OmpR family, phosphate regulon response regulator OmpR
MILDSPHIFVVEDDLQMRQMIGEYLSNQGIKVSTMGSAEELFRRMHQFRPSLIVLDISLPGSTGLEACQTIRGHGDTIPIILVTARTEEFDRVIGLEMGADDYINKPFALRELHARIKAVLRRTNIVPGIPSSNNVEVNLGNIVFQRSARRLIFPDKTERTLTTIEFSLLNELVANPKIPLSRERLLSVMHGNRQYFLPRTVDVAVMRLRKLIEVDSTNPRYIQSVRNFGYMFVPKY